MAQQNNLPSTIVEKFDPFKGPRLVLVTNPSFVYPLKRVTLIGRTMSGINLDLDGFADGEFVSGQHARISTADDTLWVLEDLDSHNGTFLDGEKLNPFRLYTLSHGKRVRFGKIAFFFYDREA